MTRARIPWYGLAVVVIVAAGFCLAVLGLTLCSPPPLRGDEAWAWSMRLKDALSILLGYRPQCFLDDRTGASSLLLASWSAIAALGVVGAAVLWEAAGREIRRAVRRSRGGHVVLAGEPGEVEPLAEAVGSGTPVAYLARDEASALAIARSHPFADVSVLRDRRRAPELMRRLGAPTARFVAAVTRNDLANGELAEAVLQGGEGDILVRLEQTSVRALKADALRRAAERAGRDLTVISLRQMQGREGLRFAMPGRYVDPDASRVHIAICGAGPMLQEVAFLVARQGYGLEHAPPLLSILRTGRSDFAAGALERLAASGIAAVHPAMADGSDGAAVDRAFSAIALNETPLAAIHCCEEEEGGALALALRLERVLVDLAVPVPPIVVHGDGPDAPGDTGMVRVVKAPNLAETRDHAALLDRRAIAFHDAYLDGQRAARGSAFGGLPAERGWQQLAESFREDNRNAADHIDYKLARAGFIAVKHPRGPSFARDDIEMLARLEHARWMASKGLGGWRFGEVRDNKLLLHPDMKSYDLLDRDAQRKDQEQVGFVTVQLARAGEAPARLRRFGLLSAGSVDQAAAALVPRLRDGELEWPLAMIALDGADGLAAAEKALADGMLVEVVVAGAPEHFFRDDVGRRRAAAILRQAWLIRIARAEAPAKVVEANSGILVDAAGRLYEVGPA